MRNRPYFRTGGGKFRLLSCLGLLGLGACGGAASTVAGRAPLSGYYAGQLLVHFEGGGGAGSACSLGEAPGEVILDYRTEGAKAVLRTLEGILPGLLPEEGTTRASLDLSTCVITGTVYPPCGDPLDLNSLMPAIRVHAFHPESSTLASEAKLAWRAKQVSTTAETAESVFRIESTDADWDCRYVYEVVMLAEVEDDSGDTVSVAVTVRRSTTQNGVQVFREIGTGSMQVRRCSRTEARKLPLSPPPRPIICDAGATQWIAPGESVVLVVGARGGESQLAFSWSPAGSLDDSTILRPTAAPTSDQGYELAVTDSLAQQAIDRVTVIVEGSAVVPLTVDAGPDRQVDPGETISLQALASGGVKPYVVLWLPETSLSNPNILAPSASPQVTTTYTITLTDAVGATTSDSVTITVEAETLMVNAGHDRQIFAGESINLQASAVGGVEPYSIEWSPGASLSAPHMLMPSAIPAVTTTYTITVTDAIGDTASDSVRISVIPHNVAQAPSVGGSGAFTTVSGQFEVAVSPQDADGNFVGAGLSNNAFRFENVVMIPANGSFAVPVDAPVTRIEVTPPGDDSGRNVTAVVIFDSSGSMGWNDSGAVARRAAGQTFFDLIEPGDQVAVLDFGAGNGWTLRTSEAPLFTSRRRTAGEPPQRGSPTALIPFTPAKDPLSPDPRHPNPGIAYSAAEKGYRHLAGPCFWARARPLTRSRSPLSTGCQADLADPSRAYCADTGTC